MIGGTVARLAVDHGHDVVVSNSRGPDTPAALVAKLGSRATAADPSGAASRRRRDRGHDPPEALSLGARQRVGRQNRDPYQQLLPGAGRPHRRT